MRKGYLLAAAAMTLLVSGCASQTFYDNGSGTSLNPSPMVAPVPEEAPIARSSCRAVQHSCKGHSSCKQIIRD
jgi:hypothetical protein